MAKASNVKIGLQSGTDRTLFATWTWSKKNTDSYSVKWYYGTGDGIWFLGDESDAASKYSTYNAPSNAIKVKFKVKPIAKKHKVNKKDVAYWTASWSTTVQYNFSSNPPSVPSTPSVTIDQYKLTAEVDNSDALCTDIEFYIVKNDSSKVAGGVAKKKTNHAAFSCNVAAGNVYKACCRALRGSERSAWSEYSKNVGTIPAAVTGITSCKATSSTSVRIDWNAVLNADSYDIEYTSNKDWFDSSDQTQSMSVEAVTHAEIVGLESGQEWFFRVRAVNEQGESGWCSPRSVIIGKAPSAPTTWSSTTTAIVGEDVTLYWVHNSEDNSSQTYAELELTVSGQTTTQVIKNSTDEDEKDKTSFFTLATTAYPEGTKIQWRVRTKGIIDQYSDWSIQRTIDVYAPPTLELSVTDGTGILITELKSFPLNITALPQPLTQAPIGYHVSIVANESYQTVDYMGNDQWINEGDEVYSVYFDTAATPLTVSIGAGDVNLDNGISYTIVCTVSMDSGLTAEATYEIDISWEDEVYEPDAEIGIDSDSLSAYIRPYCEDESGNLIEGIHLSVYRREFDGNFVELATSIENQKAIYITDPHPALDYARYRIVAISDTTGAISFYDPPGYPVGETAIIVQWDEEWKTLDTDNADEVEDQPWTGSLLRLPYNVDVSDKNNKDVAMVEYAGRKHPVTYYGTQLGHSSTWAVVIEKDDEQTLFALRRLSNWMGDVYVREPSGSGYWANVNVSFGQTHRELIIPVTLEITRVEGGV